MSVECRFCYEPFESVQAVRAHLRSCPQRRDGYRVRYRDGVGTVVAAATLTARRRVPGYPEAERSAGAPTVAVFLATLRRMGVAADG